MDQFLAQKICEVGFERAGGRQSANPTPGRAFFRAGLRNRLARKAESKGARDVARDVAREINVAACAFSHIFGIVSRMDAPIIDLVIESAMCVFAHLKEFGHDLRHDGRPSRRYL